MKTKNKKSSQKSAASSGSALKLKKEKLTPISKSVLDEKRNKIKSITGKVKGFDEKMKNLIERQMKSRSNSNSKSIIISEATFNLERSSNLSKNQFSDTDAITAINKVAIDEHSLSSQNWQQQSNETGIRLGKEKVLRSNLFDVLSLDDDDAAHNSSLVLKPATFTFEGNQSVLLSSSTKNLTMHMSSKDK